MKIFKKMLKFLFYLIILYIDLIYSYINLPFETYKTSNFYDFFNNYIFTNIDIGLEPKTNIKLLLKQRSYSFYVYDNNYYSNIIYNYKNSSRYRNILEYEFEFSSSGCQYGIFSMDTFYIQNQRNDNMTFILCTKSFSNEFKNFDGQIGLNIEYDSMSDTNLILVLKNKEIIENKIYTLYYINDNQGFLLIGEYPHNLKLESISSYEKYSEIKEENLFWINSEITKKELLWTIFFDKINFGSSELYQNKKLGKISIEIKYIISPLQYYNLFKKIYSKECENISLDSILMGFKCDINIDKKLTPEIRFYNNDLNTTFILDYNNLFIDKDNYTYFLVFSYINNSGFNDWILGKPFLKKYLFLYNQDSRMIGFYKNKEKEKNINNGDGNNKFNLYLILIILNILFLGIIITISVLFYKYYIKNKKNRANELEDTFEYISQENKIN